ncbi:MAG: hypothetical protein MHM6MM_007005 [Cercozoa sp. M6MM]
MWALQRRAFAKLVPRIRARPRWERLKDLEEPQPDLPMPPVVAGFFANNARRLQLNWFPGHMIKTVREMTESRVKQAHVVVEIRDARAPLSTANFEFSHVIRNKPRIIMYGKQDLAGLSDKEREYLRSLTPDDVVYFADSKDFNSVRGLIRSIEKKGKSSFKSLPTIVMLCGVPNVGKSSVIKTLRSNLRGRGKPTVGNTPGLTRSMSGFMVSEQPKIFMIDTPGVMVPRVQNATAALHLQLCETVKEDRCEAEIVAEYASWQLNRLGINWPKIAGIRESTISEAPSTSTEFDAALRALAHRWRIPRATGGEINMAAAAQKFLSLLHRGHFGRFVLDDVESGQHLHEDTGPAIQLDEELYRKQRAQRLKQRRRERKRRRMLRQRGDTDDTEVTEETGTQETDTEEAGTPEAGTPEANTPEAGTLEAGTLETDSQVDVAVDTEHERQHSNEVVQNKQCVVDEDGTRHWVDLPPMWRMTLPPLDPFPAASKKLVPILSGRERRALQNKSNRRRRLTRLQEEADARQQEGMD